MNRSTIVAMAAISLAAATAPALAQGPSAQAPMIAPSNGAGADFWRGAPEPVAERLGWFDMRVENGIRQGTITRSEAAHVRGMLNHTRAAQTRLLARDNGELTERDSAYMQRRLDNMARQIHWAESNGVDRHTAG